MMKIVRPTNILSDARNLRRRGHVAFKAKRGVCISKTEVDEGLQLQRILVNSTKTDFVFHYFEIENFQKAYSARKKSEHFTNLNWWMGVKTYLATSSECMVIKNVFKTSHKQFFFQFIHKFIV